MSRALRASLVAGTAVMFAAGAPQDGVGRGRLEAAYVAAKASKASAGRCEACVWWSKVDATVRLATATMNAPDLKAKEKYPKALRLYREALALDPTNLEALESSQMIVSIYQGMGREVPQ